MGKHVLVVMTNPVEGKEAQYNDWYSNVHIQEVCELPGFVSAQRFKVSEQQMGGQGKFQYLALYDIEADDVGSALQTLKEAAPKMQMSDALDPKIGVWAFTPVTDKHHAS